MMTKTAIITGITGEDSAYLAQLLLEKGPYMGTPIAARLRLISGAYCAGGYVGYLCAGHKQNRRRVRDFVDMTCKALDIRIKWQGDSVDELGVDAATGKTIVKINREFYRPAKMDLLIGDPAKAEKELGWESTTILERLCARRKAGVCSKWGPL